MRRLLKYYIFFVSELMIIEKWKNIRDASNKSLKKITGDPAKKKYLYHDNLLFMLSIFQKDNTQSSLTEDYSLVTEDDSASEETQTEDGVLSEEQRNDKAMEGQGIKQRKKKAKTMADTEIDRALIKALEKSEPKYELPPDEDELFFKSLLPAVKTLNVDEKLEFRMEVLNVVKK